jgi:hypothetical protein
MLTKEIAGGCVSHKVAKQCATMKGEMKALRLGVLHHVGAKSMGNVAGERSGTCHDTSEDAACKQNFRLYLRNIVPAWDCHRPKNPSPEGTHMGGAWRNLQSR